MTKNKLKKNSYIKIYFYNLTFGNGVPLPKSLIGRYFM